MSSDELKNILVNLEIPEDQAGIYLKLLELGEANYTELSRTTGLKRTTLYLIIGKMQKRGLVNKNVDGRKFQPTAPARLFELFQNNNLAFYHSLNVFQGLMRKSQQLTKVKFYNDKKGVQELLLDELEEYKRSKDKTLRVVGSAMFQLTDPQFFKQYQDRRKELGVKTKILAHEDVKRFEKEYAKLAIQMKYFPSGNGPFHGRVSCTQTRVTLWNLLGEQNGIIIESRGIAETFIQWFDTTWELLM